ncbi:uncharacterized protein C8orf48 homolog isoform X3 [Athene cunicularia]|uniref:uncharacterized protein C8orf48 homolog isoform X3 n=1 Tax=Athene cunicularia TaxID=194338 RepID=UPI000EF7042B|nr:uncharacterized protein C8orf48 homolog isoform X3 [Athene cunicularia]
MTTVAADSSDEQSEVADSVAIGRDAVGKWIDLKNKAAAIKQDKFVIKTHDEITELLDGELDALWSFCTIKINKMRQQLISKQANGCKSRKLQHGFTAKKAETSDLNCIVPDRLVNTIHLKNIRETVKQVKEAQIHESSVCPDCQDKKAELAKITFLRQKKILMESALIQAKLEEQIYSRDVLTRIGEALRSFPKPSENPANLWQRLKGKRQELPLFLQRLPGRPARRPWSWALLQRAISWDGTTGKGSKLVTTNSTFPSFILLLPLHQYIRTQNRVNVLAYFRQEKLAKLQPVSSVRCCVLIALV